MSSKSISVNILNNSFQVNCPAGEESNLYRSARYLEEKIQAITDTNRTLSKDRVIMMAALNIAHELITKEQQQEAQNTHSKKHVLQIIEKINQHLEKA